MIEIIAGGKPIKAWIDGVSLDESAKQQLINVSKLPFIYSHIAVMPDVHYGIGATVGSVIPTKNAIIPAAVGVDIGCGMCAVKTTLTAKQLPDNLKTLRIEIENAVPHGNFGRHAAWGNLPKQAIDSWASLAKTYNNIIKKHPKITIKNHPTSQIGTLGGGNHFIEICVDETDSVWIMLHSGSRGIGNKIGTYFIELAKNDMRTHHINLPDHDLAYLTEGTTYFADYIEAVEWAQNYAFINRQLMLQNIIAAITKHLPPFKLIASAINCHHNYVAREKHFGEQLLITRKGAVSARIDQLGIIPGSMGARSFIVRGKGNTESFHTCSHGAGRVMSRNEARKKITLAEHIQATAGVECRKDSSVIDESPAAYKNINDVMKAQADLVDIVHTLKQVLCVKG